MDSEHRYQVEMEWTGNRGKGTSDYRAYERSYLIRGADKPELLGSSDPAFRGDATKWNPEELLLAALASCHMLWYLHLCADQKIVVTEYTDRPTAVMVVGQGGIGRLEEATLHPRVVVADRAQIQEAELLHAKAHAKCFIANSVNFSVMVNPTTVGGS